MDNVTSTYRNPPAKVPEHEKQETHALYTRSTVPPPVVYQSLRYGLHDSQAAYDFYLFKQVQLSDYLEPRWVTWNPYVVAQTAEGLRDSAIEHLRLCRHKNIEPQISFEDVNTWLDWAGRSIGMSYRPEFAPISEETLNPVHLSAGEASQTQPLRAQHASATPHAEPAFVQPPHPLESKTASAAATAVEQHESKHSDTARTRQRKNMDSTGETPSKKTKTAHAFHDNSTTAAAVGVARKDAIPVELSDRACEFLRHMHEYEDAIFDRLESLLRTEPREKFTEQRMKDFVICGSAALLSLNVSGKEALLKEVAKKFWIACALKAFQLRMAADKDSITLLCKIKHMIVNNDMPRELPRILAAARPNINGEVSDYALECLDLQDVLAKALNRHSGQRYDSFSAFLRRTVPDTYRRLFSETVVIDKV